MTIETDWVQLTAQIPAQGLQQRKQATEAQRQAIAKALSLRALERLDADYRIEPLPSGRYRVTGTVRARVVQECVVTLDPIESDISETFEVEFWPPNELPEPVAIERELLEDDDPPEPIEHNRLAIGRVIYEVLAAALDPYPRKPGATLDLDEDAAEKAKLVGPFAALAKWKPD